MMRVLPDASSAFWGPEPGRNASESVIWDMDDIAPIPEGHPLVLVCIQRIWATFWLVDTWRSSGIAWLTGILTILSLRLLEES